MASSSSSSVILESKNDVFLSFRGKDTRKNFTGHLYDALTREKVAVFVDDGLQRGDEISPVLLKAIEDSKISVIIFSKDYASSRRCLEELAKIIECRTSKGQIVVPVFYYIDPSDIRKQTGSYGKPFVEHAKRFKNTPERVQMWRAALTEAANLSGYHLTENSSESEVLKDIVRDLSEFLTRSPSAVIYKKVSWELMFTVINFSLEIPSAAFDQLSSPKHPRYALYAMLISCLALVFSILELVYIARKAKVYWERRKYWFYHPSGRTLQRYYGTLEDNVGPFCALCQCIATAINYTHTSKPIQISVWPIASAFCYLCSKIVRLLQKEDVNVRRPEV